MACRRENLTNSEIGEIINRSIANRYRLRKNHIDNNRGLSYYIYMLERGVSLIFIASVRGPELIIQKAVDGGQILYHDDETQLYTMMQGDNSELSNVKIRNGNEITFNEYKAPLEKYTESRHERDVRRADMINYRGRGKSMEFDTKSLLFDLSKYTNDECLLEYFERNDFVGKEVDTDFEMDTDFDME